MYQLVTYILHTHALENHTFDGIFTWGPILHDIAWVMYSTCCTTTNICLVIERNMLFHILCMHNWDEITAKNQALTNKRNENKNKNKIHHTWFMTMQLVIKY